LAPVGFNIGSIVAGLFFRQYFDPPIVVMAWGALAGGVLQLVIQLPQLYRIGFRFKFVLSFADKAVRQIIRLMGPAALGVAAAQLNIVVGTLLASFQPTGSIAYLNYAFRLMHLPLGVFGVAVATVSLPELSSLAAEGKKEQLLSRYIRSCKMQLSFLLPSALFLIIAARPICALIYQHGKFDWVDSVNAALALQMYAAGIIFFGIVRLSAQVFYAYKNTATPVKIAALSVGINIILMLLLMKPLGFAGLALAPGLAALANFSMLAFTIRRKVGLADFSSLLIHFVKVLIAVIPAGLIVYFVLDHYGDFVGYAGVFATAYHLGLALVVSTAVFGGIGYLLGILKRS
jgi:putative peptidoglycan lipid II flippase